jgi:predicted N-acetyltransferase YhbS
MEFRYTETEADVLTVFELIANAATTIALVPPNPDKMLRWVWDVCKTGGVMMALDEGRCVASLGMQPVHLDYSDSQILVNAWLYVLPSHEGDLGIMSALLREGRELADSMGMPLIITRTHSSPRKGKRGIYPVAEVLRYQPLGSQLAYQSA